MGYVLYACIALLRFGHYILLLYPMSSVCLSIRSSTIVNSLYTKYMLPLLVALVLCNLQGFSEQRPKRAASLLRPMFQILFCRRNTAAEVQMCVVQTAFAGLTCMQCTCHLMQNLVSQFQLDL